MTKVFILLTLTFFFLARQTSAEDAAYPMSTEIDCRLNTYQSVAIDFELPSEILFLVKYDTSDVRLTAASIGDEIAASGPSELYVRRASYGVVFSLDGVGLSTASELRIKGTVEVFDTPKFCALIEKGIYLHIQNGISKLATIQLVEKYSFENTGSEARNLTLDRVGQTYFDDLNYYLSSGFAWRDAIWPRDIEIADKVNGSPTIDGPWPDCLGSCEYTAAVRSFYKLLKFMEAYELQRADSFESPLKLKFSQLRFPKSFKDRCMSLGADDFRVDLCVLASSRLGLATELEHYKWQVADE